jgi:hypothetical protein
VTRVTAPRRSPKFTSFLLTGAILGFIAGSARAYYGDPAPGYGQGAAVAYVGIFGAAIGALLAGVLAVLLDRRK